MAQQLYLAAAEHGQPLRHFQHLVGYVLYMRHLSVNTHMLINIELTHHMTVNIMTL